MSRRQGKIRLWKDDKGYGFIEPNGGGEDVFVHATSVIPGKLRPGTGSIVSYRLGWDELGRARAFDVDVLPNEPPSKSPQPPRETVSFSALPVGISVGFLLILTLLVAIGSIHAAVIPIYLVASWLSYLLYGLDKVAAREGGWRVSEATLHGLDLLGGWPGGLIARHRYRHKTKKESFVLIFWCTAVLNCFILGSVATKDGLGWLSSMFALIATS